MLGRKVIYVRYLNCSYNNVAKGIRLLDKKAFLNRNNFMQVIAFERYIPLRVVSSEFPLFANVCSNLPDVRIDLTLAYIKKLIDYGRYGSTVLFLAEPVLFGCFLYEFLLPDVHGSAEPSNGVVFPQPFGVYRLTTKLLHL